jgi:ankyrin repeat protein
MRRATTSPIWGVLAATVILSINLLTGCADNDNKPLKYQTIHEAAEKGDLEDIKNHLRKGTAVNERRDTKLFDDVTPLHLASYAGHAKVVDFLLRNGAEVNAEARSALKTPLHLAVDGGHAEVVKLLVKRGANVNARGWGDITPLHIAAEQGNGEMVTLLLKAGADVMKAIPRDRRLSPGMIREPKISIRARPLSPITVAFAQGYKELGLQIAASVDVKAKTEDGETLLHLVTGEGNVEAMKFLIARGADVNAKDNEGKTPLHTAVYMYIDRSSPELRQAIELLIRSGADVNARNINGNTPLHITVLENELEIVKLLIENGADVNALNNNVESPKALLLKRINPRFNREWDEVLDLLHKHGAK